MTGGSALIIRIHHCMGDGFWLLAVLLSLTDIDPDGTGSALPRATPPEHGPSRHHPTKALAASRRLSRGLRDLAHLLALPFDPSTRLRGHPRGERRLAWSKGIELSRVKALARERDATINDVLLAALAGALRRYIIDHGDAPVGFRAIVPVNLRPLADAIDEVRGNWFGLVFADLPVAEPDREARLVEVVRTMARIKVSEEAMVSLAVMGVLGRLPAALEHAADNLLARKGTLVVTNVPGPRRAIHLAGRRIRDMTFWAPHSCGLSCGASILSYAGVVRVGVRSDAAVVQDPELLARLFEKEFAAWEEESDQRKKAPPTCE
jgi:WS/DGAT/MGAT family acyltransferase